MTYVTTKKELQEAVKRKDGKDGEFCFKFKKLLYPNVKFYKDKR